MEGRSITLKDVAEQSGYSLRTVKKVYSEKSDGVRKETRDHILDTGRLMGYKKNMAASALAMSKVTRIAIVMGDFKHFFPKAKEGFLSYYEEIRDMKFAIDFYTPGSRSLSSSRELLNELLEDEHTDAVIMHASSMSGLNAQINALVAAGKPVFTFGADAPSSNRVCYIGPRAYESGRIAAQLMSNYIGRSGNVYIINQSMEEMQTLERNHGFLDYINEKCPSVRVQQVLVQMNQVSYYDTVKEILQEDVDGIIGADADCYIIGDVIKELKDTETVGMGFDLTEETEKMLREDHMKVILSQNPDKQAATALQMMCRYILNQSIDERNVFTDISIITSECLSD